MKTFTDNTGRSWTVSLNIGTLKRVRSLCEVDLMAAVEGKLIDRLIADPVLLCDILYVVCKEEADKNNITRITSYNVCYTKLLRIPNSFSKFIICPT